MSPTCDRGAGTVTDVALWERWNSSGGPNYPSEKVVQYTFRCFPPALRKGTRVLDLGCGSGINTWFLAREGFRVTASDVALAGLANTRARLMRDALQAELVRADAGLQPFPDASFDYLICVRVLELLPRPELQNALVAECSRLLVRGGRGLVMFASALDYGFQHPEMSPAPFYPPDERQVDDMFKPRFSSVDIDTYQTSYQGGKLLEHNFLITVVR